MSRLDVHPTRKLASFVAELHFEAIPSSVVARTEELFLDRVGCTLAGKNSRPVLTPHSLC